MNVKNEIPPAIHGATDKIIANATPKSSFLLELKYLKITMNPIIIPNKAYVKLKVPSIISN